MREIQTNGVEEELSGNKIPDNKSVDGYESLLVEQSNDYQYLSGEEKEKKAMELVDELLKKAEMYKDDLILYGIAPKRLYAFYSGIGYQEEGLAKLFLSIPIEGSKNKPATLVPEKAIPYIREQIVQSEISADQIIKDFEHVNQKIEESYADMLEELEEKQNSEEIAEIRSASKTEDSNALQKIRKFLGLK